MLLNPALGRLRHANLCEFKASLIYIVRFRTASTIQRISILRGEKSQKDIGRVVTMSNKAGATSFLGPQRMGTGCHTVKTVIRHW